MSSPARPSTGPAADTRDVLAGLWSRVLGAPPDTPDSDFFAMGGDSLAAIRLAELAREADIALLPGDVLRRPRFGDLASGTPAPASPPAGTAVIPGRTPLTPPQQQWMRGSSPMESKLARTLVAAGRFDGPALERAARLMVERHDALRERFQPAPGAGWSGTIDPEAAHPPIVSVDLTDVDEGDRPDELRRLLAAARAEIDITAGPLVRLIHVRMRPPADDRLIFACHYLGMDYVSGRIFLAELFTAYRHLAAGREPSLLPATTSLSAWAHRLHEHAQTDAVRQDAVYWLGRPWDRVRPLPAALPGSEVESEAGDVMTSVVLPRTATEALTHRCVGGRVSMLGILLAVVARAHRAVTGVPVLSVYVVKHGRDRVFPDLDVGRSVGWFAHRIPWLVDAGAAHSAGALAARVSAELADLPDGGLRYGLLRDLVEDGGIRAAMRTLPRPEAVIQYLGISEQLDEGIWPAELGTDVRQIVADDEAGALAPNFDWVRLWCHGRIAEGRLHLRLHLYTAVAGGVAVKQPVRGLAEAVVDEVRGLLTEDGAP